MSQLKLVISDDEGRTTVVPLVHGTVSIGRHESNIIRLTERNVSRRHARLRRVQGGYVLEDLGSNNGVLLNGERLQGERPVIAGDCIRIGDYEIVAKHDDAPVEIEVPLPPIVAGPPERFVMLTLPAPGAMYALGPSGTRIGRHDGCEVRINDPDIADEHARIERRGKDAVLIDVSGRTSLNGAPLTEAVLRPGDVVELGRVRLRYIPAGEEYDPNFDRTVLIRSVPPEPTTFGALKIALLVGAAATAMLILAVAAGATDWFRDASDAAGAPGRAASPGVALEAAAAQTRAYLDECRRALGGERWVEAALAAERAQAASPGSPEAAECAAAAAAGRRDQDHFSRAQTALASGDIESAFRAFEGLPLASPLRSRPEVAEVRRRYIALHLEGAQAAVPDDVEGALRHVHMVLAVENLDEVSRSRAETIEAQARAVAAAEPSGKATAPATPGDRARECLRRNDARCVIEALEGGRARSPALLALLIRAYRDVGNEREARTSIQAFLDRYPDDPRAPRLQELLERP